MNKQARPIPHGWASLKRRARTQHSTIARTHPDDGRERYILICGDWYEVFHHIEHLVDHIEEEEARQRAIEDAPAIVWRRRTAEEIERDRQQGYLGALSSAIGTHDRILSGEQAVSRVTLTMAQSEGRDYMSELRARRAANVRLRFDISCDLAATGKAPRRHAEYQRAFQALADAGER